MKEHKEGKRQAVMSKRRSTDKKENKTFLIYKEIQMESGATVSPV
jgi:hypothetical protein